jgi:hypothetical protein
LAAGIEALPDTRSSFAYTQAAWRFFRNVRIGLQGLAEPLLAAVEEALKEHCGRYVLAMHDWSRLNYNSHTRKHDRLQMTHRRDVGYELQSSVLVSDRSGKPLVPVVHNLVTAEAVYSTMSQRARARKPHLEELTERMGFLQDQGWSKPLVHIVDREADSVAHLRAWAKRGHCFIVRADDASRVCCEAGEIKLKALAEELTYEHVGEVLVKDKPAQQRIARAPVVLTRKAKPAQPVDGKRVTIAGEPLALRLVVSRLYDANGSLLAQWLLLTNLPADVDDATVARWYYYRWQIESMFKLLKSAGQQVEEWMQDDGLTIAKRLVVASCACLVVWQLAAAQSPQALEAQRFLVRLSGRQTKRRRPVTAPALFAGLWMLLSTLEILEHYDIDQLKQYAALIFPNRHGP